MAEQTVDEKEEPSCEKEEDSFFCDVCNITFDVPKAYFAHVYSVSHLQRANAAEKQAPKVGSTISIPVVEIPASINATESKLKLGQGTTVGTEAGKGSTSKFPGCAVGSLSIGEPESVGNPPLLSNVPGSNPVELHGVAVNSNLEQPGSMPPQVATGSMTVAPQAVSSMSSMLSDVTMDTAVPGCNELTKNSGTVPDIMQTSLLNAGKPQPPTTSISMSVQVSTPPKSGAAKMGPLLSTPKIPSLMSVSGARAPRPQGSGFVANPTISPSMTLLSSRPQSSTTVAPPIQKIPLLRSPPPVSSSFSPSFSGLPDTFSTQFPTPYMAKTYMPRPATSSHHSGPLLPTPATPVRGALLGSPVPPLLSLAKPTTPASRPAYSRSWDLSSFGNGDDLQPLGIEVKDYNHGQQAELTTLVSYDTDERIVSHERDVKPSLKPLLGSYVEPLIDGSWTFKLRPSEEKKRINHCQVCNVKFDNFLFHELHLAGLRHRKMAKSLGSKPSVAGATKSGAFHSPFEKMDDFEVDSHDPVFVTGLLDPNQMSSSTNVSASGSSGCYSELEQKLHSHSDPILGVDYLTEYRFLGGRLEYSCDLCDVELGSVVEVLDHVTSTDHRLQYLCYNDVEKYKIVSKTCDNGNSVREVAEEIEKKSGRKSRVHVKLESDDLSSDGHFTWIELKDESIRSVSALPGHRLNAGYSSVKPHKATVTVDSIDSLLQTLALHSCLAANRPPSLVRPLRRLDFISALGDFSMTSDKDADICFQLANFLTVAVINFRCQMLPSLNAVDVSAVEKKLTSLLRSAEAVTQKIIAADPTELDLNRTESGQM